VPVWDGDDKKTLRYQKIAEEAAKQCGRGRLVEVSLCESLDSVLADMKANDVCFACYEKEGERSLKQILSEKKFETPAFVIGPEGGLSEREVALLEAHSIPTVTPHPKTLLKYIRARRMRFANSQGTPTFQGL
jgi:16S rRNA (uracil1498-N3)-methyltransferase